LIDRLKTTSRSSLKRGQSKSGGGKTKAGKAASKAGAKSGVKSDGKRKSLARKPAAQIPVRGSRKSKSKLRPRDAVPTPRPRGDLGETRELAVAAMQAALEKHALEPILIDVSELGSYTDFIGIVSGRSDRQVDAIADSVCQVMKGLGHRVYGQEGSGNGRWTLLDFGAFVIHVFYHPVREFYDLESLWIEAPRVKLDVPPEATLPQPDALYGAL
jgi:ribosome-associated protein